MCSINYPTTPMRTSIVIDDKLMRDALRVTGAKNKREAVELGLQTLVRLNRQAQARQYKGKLMYRSVVPAFGKSACACTGPTIPNASSAMPRARRWLLAPARHGTAGGRRPIPSHGVVASAVSVSL
jgi:Arc/MetJ family transcription regulator